MDLNFSCSDYGVSRSEVTEEAWTIESGGKSHDDSITALVVVQIAILVIGIPWNTYVLAVVVWKKKYKDPSYALLINLVIANLLVCAFVLPFNIYSAILRGFFIGNSDFARCRACQTVAITITSFVFVSIFTLAAMSLDRLMFIKWPHKHGDIVTVKKVVAVILSIWIVSTLISLPPTFGFGEMRFSNLISACSPLTSGRSALTSNINYFIFAVMTALLPFMITLVANVWLLKIACRRVKRSKQRNRGDRTDINRTQTTSTTSQEQFHLAKVFGAIFVVDVITWLPIVLLAPVQLGIDDVPEVLYGVVYLCVISQPAIHPIVETCLIGKARVTIFKYLQNCGKKSTTFYSTFVNKCCKWC